LSARDPAALAVPPAFVDITWMSIANMYYELGSLNIVTDGYISRLPQSEFFGGGGGLAQTRRPFKPDVAAVTRVMNALGKPSKVDLLLTGHSHWDHSFDTATWSKLTGARIIGSKTTCLQAQAEGIPVDRCRAVFGRETIALAEGVRMRVVRWNHSGDPAVNPEQHNPVELTTAPVPDPVTGVFVPAWLRIFPTAEATADFCSPLMSTGRKVASAGSIRTPRASSICTCRSSSTAWTTRAHRESESRNEGGEARVGRLVDWFRRARPWRSSWCR
jgi:hypothetical protein